MNKEVIKTCMAKTFAGLEGPLEEELKAMGYRNVKPIKRGVHFDSDLKGLYMANLNLRTALSVLYPIHDFRFNTKDDFYKKALAVEWETFFDIKRTFLVRTTVFGQFFANSNYPGLLVKDAIADRFRKKMGKRPNVDKERPDVVVDVYVNEKNCTISLNSSGNPLFMRGYRNISFEAPLNECLAAGMIYLSGWKTGEAFVNPMCGSGTLVTEAAMMAMNVHPAKLRDDFAFTQWKNFDEHLFKSCREELISKELKKPSAPIQASDVSSRAVSTTRNSLILLGLEEHVEMSKMNVLKPKISTKSGMVILNPPYDVRLKEEDIEALYAGIGRSLKFDYVGHKAFVFSSNQEAIDKIGLKPFKKLDLYNGKIPCKFLGYELYAS